MNFWANFMFSANAVVPIFIIVFLGWVLNRYSVFPHSFFVSSEKVVFRLALPVLLFYQICSADTSTPINPRMFLFVSVGTVLFFLLPFLILPKLIPDRPKRASFHQAIFRGNFAILGIPLANALFGAEGQALAAMLVAVLIPLYNSFAVVVLSFAAPGENNDAPFWKRAGKIVLNIFKNPLIIAVLLALPFFLFQIKLPAIILKSTSTLGNMAQPLALMNLGACFDISQLRGRIHLAALAGLIKTVLFPGIAVLIAALLGFRGIELGCIYLSFGAPTAVSSYIMAKSMGADYELAGQALLVSTLLSLFTVFTSSFLLRTFGLI